MLNGKCTGTSDLFYLSDDFTVSLYNYTFKPYNLIS